MSLSLRARAAVSEDAVFSICYCACWLKSWLFPLFFSWSLPGFGATYIIQLQVIACEGIRTRGKAGLGVSNEPKQKRLGGRSVPESSLVRGSALASPHKQQLLWVSWEPLLAAGGESVSTGLC